MPSTSMMKFAVTNPQYNPRMVIYASVSGALTTGKFDGTIASGGTGIYIITFNKPYVRVPEVVGTSSTDNMFVRLASVTQFAATIHVKNIVGGALTAGNFSIFVHGSDSADATRY